MFYRVYTVYTNSQHYKNLYGAHIGLFVSDYENAVSKRLNCNMWYSVSNFLLLIS